MPSRWTLRGPAPRPTSSRPTVRPLAVVFAMLLVLVAVAATALAAPGGAGAQGAPTTSTTRASSTTAAVKSSTSAVATTAAPTSAAPTTAAPSTTAPETTSSTSTTSTTAASTTTLPAPPAVENSRFPARLVAPVPPIEAAPEIVVNALYVTASEDAQAPDVVVHFRSPFALPNTRYQVALFVGDPGGQRARATFVSSTASAKPTGTIEIGDGTTWSNATSTAVQHDPSGFVVIRVPLAATPAGGAVWAEVTEGSSSTPALRTPYFDRTAFFGSADAGTLPASRFGHVNTAAGASTADVAALEPGPVVTVHDNKISVKYSDAPLTALLGQPVQGAVDLVRIVPNFDTGGVVGDYIRIDRTAGTATLFDATGATPVDKSGDRTWIVRGPDAPPGPTTLLFDLADAARQLDIPIAADRTGIGLTRQYALADGRVVTADGVVATNAWLDLAPAPLGADAQSTAPAAPTTATTNEDRTKMLAAAGAVALLVLVLLAVVLVRRRRRRREDAAVTAAMAERAAAGDRVPWAKDDSQLTLELDRVVIPGTAENSLLPASGEVPVVRAAGPSAAVEREPTSAAVLAVEEDRTSATVPAVEAEPPPSVGHAGPVPWRSGQTGPTPVLDDEDHDAGDHDAGDHDAGDPGGDAAADAEPEDLETEGVAPSAPAIASAPLPVDPRRRRASGVVIAGPAVGDLTPRTTRVATPAGASSAGREPTWAGPTGPAPAPGPGPAAHPEPRSSAEPERPEPEGMTEPAPEPAAEEISDSSQIDPSDALAALDLDLGSFRTRLVADDADAPEGRGPA